MTQDFRTSLLEKARSIRYQAYRNLGLKKSDKQYLAAIEDIVGAMDAKDVIESMEEVVKEAKRDGLES